MTAQCSPPPSEPANSAFLRIAGSTTLLSTSMWPSSRRRVNPSYALLPGGQQGITRLFGEKHGTAVASLKIACRELTAVQQRECQPVREYRAQLFHQIEGQARPAGSFSMQKADRWIEPISLQQRYGGRG